MKTIRLLTLASFLAAANAYAQWVVYDPTVHTQQIVDQAQNIAKYVEMINNQIEQINTLTSQLQELEKYNEAFGNPARLLDIAGVNGLVRDLRRTELGQTIEQVRRLTQGTDAFNYDAGGIYHSIGRTFRTPSGTEVEREEKIYRDNAAVQRSTQNYTNVVGDVRERRTALKDQIAVTTQKLQSATTASEVQKLTGVLIGLNGALAATDKELDYALSLSIVQEVENRNDTERQVKARTEEQKAEFTETLDNYRTTFRPLTEVSRFPEDRR
jgi:uncharacterized phage infection (PIP) family protein YhgE